MAILATLLFCIVAATGQNAPNASLSAAESKTDMLFMLLQIQADAQGNLNDLDLDVANAAQNLSNTGLEEGYNGTVLAYPVFSPQGELLRGIAAIVVPHKLMNTLVAPQLHFNTFTRSNITDYSFWGMDLDGLIAYDRDESQIGKYLLEDPLYEPYPSLLELGHRIRAWNVKRKKLREAK